MPSDDVLAALDFEPKVETTACGKCQRLEATYSVRCTTPACFSAIMCTRCANSLAAAVLVSSGIYCAVCHETKPALLAVVIVALPPTP